MRTRNENNSVGIAQSLAAVQPAITNRSQLERIEITNGYREDRRTAATNRLPKNEDEPPTNGADLMPHPVN
jgi:hypothetical protein